MIPVIDVYNDAKDQILEEENGQFSYSLFNRLSWRAQLRLIDWLSGDVAAVQPPEPFLTSKNKDWLAPFIVSTNGSPDKESKWPLPAGFYRLWNFSIIGSHNAQDCETGEITKVLKANTPGEVIDGNEMLSRGNSYIDELREIPTTKIINNCLEFWPSDPGSFRIEYLRYPAKAEIKLKHDPVYNDEVADAATSTNFEWPPYAQELLVWYIVDLFFNRTRERAGKEANMVTKKTDRG